MFNEEPFRPHTFPMRNKRRMILNLERSKDGKVPFFFTKNGKRSYIQKIGECVFRHFTPNISVKVKSEGDCCGRPCSYVFTPKSSERMRNSMCLFKVLNELNIPSDLQNIVASYIFSLDKQSYDIVEKN